MANTNILSIDGGGIKGIISAIIIAKVEELLQKYTGKPQARITDYFHLIAGTSTGAILAGLYLAPNQNNKPLYSAQDVVNLYIKHGAYIFQKKLFYPINTCFGLFGSKYKNKHLQIILNQYLGNTKVSELLQPCLITAYDPELSAAKFFNKASADKHLCKNYLLKDVIMASTAAPTYFPPVQIHSFCNEAHTLIDGGIFANNPCMCALIEALKLDGINSIADIHILSVGNITRKKPYMYSQISKWGLSNWAVPMFDMIMDANTQTVDYQLKTIFNTIKKPKNYLRIENFQDDVPKMDDVSPENIKNLVDIGTNLAASFDTKLHNYVKAIIQQANIASIQTDYNTLPKEIKTQPPIMITPTPQ